MAEISDGGNKAHLYIYHAAQCDPAKCTALKLLRLGLVKRISKLSLIPKNAIVLDPYSNDVLTGDDRSRLLRFGLVAIDCSWENAEEFFTFKIKATKRRLPDLLAVNPINYGVRGKLSTVEAFAGALITCGLTAQAQEILSKFKWGMNFIELNGING